MKAPAWYQTHGWAVRRAWYAGRNKLVFTFVSPSTRPLLRFELGKLRRATSGKVRVSEWKEGGKYAATRSGVRALPAAETAVSARLTRRKKRAMAPSKR